MVYFVQYIEVIMRKKQRPKGMGIKFQFKHGHRVYIIVITINTKTFKVQYDKSPFIIYDVLGKSHCQDKIYYHDQQSNTNSTSNCYLKVYALRYRPGIHITCIEPVKSKLDQADPYGISAYSENITSIKQDIDTILSTDSRLRSLDISDTGIKHIDVENNLLVLLQNGCGIEQIDSINLTKLKNWELSHNKISKIENLEQLRKLEQLDLRANDISKIENLEQLRNLEILDLSWNRQTRRIENLEQLRNLRVLDLSWNGISKIEN